MRWSKSIASASFALLAFSGIECLAGNAPHIPLKGEPGYTIWSFGVKGGVNSAKMENDLNRIDRKKLGFNAGLMFEARGNGPISIAFEPTYVVKGEEFKIEKSIEHAQLEYAEFPLLVRLNVPFGGIFRIYGMAGPNMTVNLNVDLNGESILAGNDVEPLDLVWDVGAGAGLTILPGVSILSEFRYSAGLDGIMQEDTETLQQWDVRNLKVSTGLLFRLSPSL